MVVAFVADVEFMWGHASSQAGMSKSPSSFLYPPPTTIIGALAASIGRRTNYGEKRGRDLMRAIATKLLAVSFRPLNFIPFRFQDLNRIIAVRVRSGVHYPSPDNIAASFDAPARGKTVFISIDGNPPIMRIYMVFKEESLSDGLNIREEDFWHFRRIGTKEALVSTIDVKSPEVHLRRGKVIVKSAFPLLQGVKRVEILSGDWTVEEYIDPFDFASYGSLEGIFDGRIRHLLFSVPRSLTEPKYMLEISEGAVGFDVGGEIIIGIGGEGI